MNIVYHAGHDVRSPGHGGNHRALQIAELLEARATPVNVVREHLAGTRLWNARCVAHSLARVYRSPWNRYLSLRGHRNFGAMIQSERRALSFGPAIHIFDTGTCVYEWMIPNLQRNGSKVVFIPQNIDSLTPDCRHPLSQTRSPKWLAREVLGLSKADLVFTISREEQWLLGTFGIGSLYLPYSPPRALKNELQEVRSRRDTSVQDVVLVLGSATNPPTRLGMLEIARSSRQLADAHRDLRFVVCGRGTERMRESFAPGFSVLGEVSPEVLRELLIQSVAMVAFQAGTSGVLTRISEMIHAGVPVIANSNAARSFGNCAGVMEVANAHELSSLLGSRPFRVTTAGLASDAEVEGIFWRGMDALTH